MAKGLMPSLSKLREGGSWGKLATLKPMLSPMLWTSIATGKAAKHHGICGFTEPLPDGSGIRSVTSTSRRCQALWNILTQRGMRSHVVGWYASHPAEPILGAMVSNQFELPSAPLGEAWKVPSGSVHPAEVADELASLRVHPGEITGEAILPFVPNAAADHLREGNKLGELRSLLAQTSSVHAIATKLMMRDDWDLMAVYYEGIDRFAHAFMEFHSPRMKHVSDTDFEAYRHVMTGVYRFHDMMLEALMTLAGEETAVVLISDHGYLDDARRPDPAKAGPVDWHRALGLAALGGAGIKRGERLMGASLLDVTPTVLRLLGLPAGMDMPGRVWLEALEGEEAPDRILSWEDPKVADGRHPADLVEDPEEEAAALQQLIDLGYIEAPSEDAAKTVRDTRAHNDLTLAQSMFSLGDTAEALGVLEGLPDVFREEVSVRGLVAQCHLLLGDGEACRSELAAMGDSDEAVAQRALLLGGLALREGREAEALAHYEAAERVRSDDPGLLSRLAGLQLKMDRSEAAEGLYRRVVALVPEDATSWDGLAEALLRQGRAEEGLEAALEAVGLAFSLARVHYRLAKALVAVGEFERAREAVEASLLRSRYYEQAHLLAAEIYERLGMLDRVGEQKRLAAEARLAVSGGLKTG